MPGPTGHPKPKTNARKSNQPTILRRRERNRHHGAHRQTLETPFLHNQMVHRRSYYRTRYRLQHPENLQSRCNPCSRNAAEDQQRSKQHRLDDGSEPEQQR